MFGRFKKQPEPVVVESKPEASTMTAILGVQTQPLLIDPDASADMKQKLYRKDAIERYVTQRKEEKRPIPDAKMRELEDEYTMLVIGIRRLKSQENA